MSNVLKVSQQEAIRGLLQKGRSKRRIARELDTLGSTGGQHGFQRGKLRKEIEACDRDTYLNAQQKLTALREEAIGLARPIFLRLADEFDKELNATPFNARQSWKKWAWLCVGPQGRPSSRICPTRGPDR
jgi:hypothetical protein